MLLKDKVVVVSGIGPGLGIHLATLAAARAPRSSSLRVRRPSCTTPTRHQGSRDRYAGPQGADRHRARRRLRRLVAQSIDAFGRIDGLINSAYVPGVMGPVETANLDDWRNTFEVNLFGSLNLIQAALPHMKLQRGGSIVNVNSQVVRKPLAGQGGYAASKAALACATSYLALECGKYGIRFNSVYMGWMWGPAVANYFEGMARELKTTVDALKQNVTESIALGIIPEDRECAKSVLYLLSDLHRS